MGSEAFRVQTRVFMPHMRNTAVKLARGETLFCLTDRGLTECPAEGPDEVLIITEGFGSWPVVAFATPHAAEWRTTTADDHARMMRRVRRALQPRSVAPSTPEPRE